MLNIAGGLIAVMLACIAITGTRPAVAAEGVIEEIVVTARKRAESLQEVPVAVSAFSGEEMERQNVQEFVDVQAQLPGVYITQTQADPTIARISIRGQEQPGTLLTTDASVGVYIDGVNLPRQAGLNANLFDLERVEVLKGPQGTLYRRNNTGGAINLFSRKADYEGTHGYLRASAGNESYTQFAGAANIPLADNAAVRLAAQKTDQDGFGKSNFTGADLYDQDEVFLRGSLTWDPTDRMNIQLQADYMKADEGGAAEKLVQPGGNILDPNNSLPTTPALVAGIELGVLNPAHIPSRANPIPGPTFIPGLVAGYNALVGYTQGSLLETDANADVFSKATLWGGGLTIDYELNDSVSLKSVTGYRDWKSDRLLDMDGTPFTILHPFLFVDADIVTQEVQLLGSTPRLDWVVGGFYSKEEGLDGSHTLSVRVLNPTRNITEGKVTNKSWALFAQGTYALNESLNLTAGLRWTEETKELVNMNRLELADLPGRPIA
ncbi:MAG: TonB-dependent receptor, partial [Gammaproteobacteria bacterium]|nr:TonB-dependent receptor [Gammaproteobacteria bacterium]